MSYYIIYYKLYFTPTTTVLYGIPQREKRKKQRKKTL